MKGNYLLLFLVFWPIIGAFVSFAVGKINRRARDYFANFVTIVETAVAIYLFTIASNSNPPTFEWTAFANVGIYLKLDGFRSIYVVITSFMWMMTTIFSREYFAHYRNRNRYYFFLLLTFGATVAVFLSADLLTTFVFFEIMSIASYVMVVHDERPASMRAGDTYMAVAVIGGLVMLMGIFLVHIHVGTTNMDLLASLSKASGVSNGILYLAGALMIFGYGGKAGMYPLHIWLPNAHPVAPAPASALLSGVLTKTGVFGIIIVSIGFFFNNDVWGYVILVIGVLGMFTGAFIALFSIDLKRTLACSSMSQIGFVLVAVGMQNILTSTNHPEYAALATNGGFLHMVNHSLIKLALFMMAGVVYMNLHELNLNKVRGFGRGKFVLTFVFLMGLLGIAGVPLWNGYISKTMIHESIVERIWIMSDYSFLSAFFMVVESIFTLTGGLTTAYMIKIFVAVCVEKNPYVQDEYTANKKYINPTTAIVLLVSATILPILGYFPNGIMKGLGEFGGELFIARDLFTPAELDAVIESWYGYHMTIDHVFEVLPTWLCLKGAVASLGIGAILYVFVVRTSLMRTNKDGHREYVNVWPVWLDIENQIYRPLLLNVLPFFGALFARFVGSIPGWIASFGYKLASKFFAFDSKSLAAATAPVWEGEADIVSVIKSMDIVTAKIEQKRAQELAAKEVEEGHGHHGHAHEEDQKPSFGERFVASARGEKIDDRTFIGKICDFLGIREDYTEVLRSSVTSSLALFAIGAAIIILIVILL